MGLSEIYTSVGSPEMQKSVEASTTKDLSLYRPPPYSFIEATNLGSPLLSVGGWNIYHAGIEWRKNTKPHQTTAVLFLAFQAADPLEVVDRVSCLKFRIVQDKVIRSSSIPRELWTRPLKLDRSGAIGRWSEQTIKDVGYRDTSEIFLKLEPKSNPDDQGIYFFSITLEQACTLPPSNPEIAKFDFHLEASTIGRHLICDWIRRLWSWPIVSERIDNERTLDSEVAKLVLQYR